MCKSTQMNCCAVPASQTSNRYPWFIEKIAQRNRMVMSFTKKYCDIELEHYLKSLVNKHGKLAKGMLGVLDKIIKITFLTLLMNKLISLGSSQWGKNIELKLWSRFSQNYKTCTTQVIARSHSIATYNLVDYCITGKEKRHWTPLQHPGDRSYDPDIAAKELTGWSEC